jgi:hypothetical protein
MRAEEQQSYQLVTDRFPVEIGRFELLDQFRQDIFIHAGTDRFVRPATGICEFEKELFLLRGGYAISVEGVGYLSSRQH